MEHEFVFIDGVNINATHLLSDKVDAVKELMANDQIPGKDEAEKKDWISRALPLAKQELQKRAEDRKKKAEEKKKQEAAAAQASGTAVAAPLTAATASPVTTPAGPAK